MAFFHTVPATESGQRLDRYLLKQFPHLNFAQVQELLRTGQIRVGGKRAKASDKLEGSAELRLPPQINDIESSNEYTLSKQQQKTLERAILYRDADMMVLNKPSGLAVQGGSGIYENLDDMLKSWAKDQTVPIQPKLVHRLDKETSGVLLIALHREAAAALALAFKQRTMEKLYWALVVGVPQLQQGRVDAAILKNNSVFGDKMQIDEDGKKARTDYRIITKVFKQAAWLELRPQEGRTHQLRVHCAALGTPIQGDDKYSERKDFIQGEGISEQLHLHCRQMSIVHPKTNKNMTFVAPLPPHMVATWEFLGLELSEGS